MEGNPRSAVRREADKKKWQIQQQRLPGAFRHTRKDEINHQEAEQ